MKKEDIRNLIGQEEGTELDDMAFLTKIGAYHVNREDGTEGFTRAGILMLGKTDSITDQSCAPLYFVDYQEKLSSGKDGTIIIGLHRSCRRGLNPTRR